MKRTAKFRKNRPPKSPDDDSVPELGDTRPDRLADVRPQDRVQRHTVEQIIVPMRVR